MNTAPSFIVPPTPREAAGLTLDLIEAQDEQRRKLFSNGGVSPHIRRLGRFGVTHELFNYGSDPLYPCESVESKGPATAFAFFDNKRPGSERTRLFLLRDTSWLVAHSSATRPSTHILGHELETPFTSLGIEGEVAMTCIGRLMTLFDPSIEPAKTWLELVKLFNSLYGGYTV